uniref:CCHC-type domain-containing protein n=1 Tax=Otolemur garnettii TaxID=30611 RepID=H0XI94_OTOGA
TTRWARITTTRSKRPLSATSWEDKKKQSFEGTSQNLPKHKQVGTNRPSLKNDAPQAKHKKNKKKKEYLNEDVNGFMEYPRQNSQMVHNGEITASDIQEVREEIAVALKKDSGHLSRSCPDNPKRLYADGGGCKLCGSVKHLKKDCPESQNSDRMVTIGRWAKGMSADYEEILDAPKPQKPKTKIPKIVKF